MAKTLSTIYNLNLKVLLVKSWRPDKCIHEYNYTIFSDIDCWCAPKLKKTNTVLIIYDLMQATSFYLPMETADN